MGAFVALVGPVCAGKSTVVRPLANALGFSAHEERLESNPFFGLRPKERWAFHTEVAFLVSALESETRGARHEQGCVIERPSYETFELWVPCLFADGCVGREEYEILKRLALLSEGMIGLPDVVVALDAPTDVLVRRAQLRRHEGDEYLTRQILEAVRTRYHNWLCKLPQERLVEIDTSVQDVRTEKCVAGLVCKVQTILNHRARPLRETSA